MLLGLGTGVILGMSFLHIAALGPESIADALARNGTTAITFSVFMLLADVRRKRLTQEQRYATWFAFLFGVLLLVGCGAAYHKDM